MAPSIHQVVYLIVRCSLALGSSYVQEDAGLTEVPLGIPSTVTEVDLEENYISSLDGRLDHITNLEILELDKNEFTTFPTMDQFGETLLTLELDENYISSVDTTKLIPLVKLEYFDFEENRMTIFPDLTPVGPTLELLWIGWNSFSSIDPKLISPFVRLKELGIDGNQLKTFTDLSALGNTLEILWLNSNHITIITASSIELLRTLKYLNLRYNPISTIDSETMSVFNGIEDVNIDKTMLSSLGPADIDKYTDLDIDQTQVDLCSCNHVWLKKAETLGSLDLDYDDVRCSPSNKWWSGMTYEELHGGCAKDACSESEY